MSAVALSNFLQAQWVLTSPLAAAIDWPTDRTTTATWANSASPNNVIVACFEVGGSSGRSSESSVVTDEIVEVKVMVRGQANLSANQALRNTVFVAVRAILATNFSSLINGNLKISALRLSGAFDVSQYSSRDVIVTLQYPEGT
jgi:hypothetical protein